MRHPERRRFAGRRMEWLETILRRAAILRSAQDPPPPRVSDIRHPASALRDRARAGLLSAGDLPGAGWNGLKRSCAGQTSCARRRIRRPRGYPAPGIRHPPFAIVPERAVLSAGDLPGAGWNGLKRSCAGQTSCARRRIRSPVGIRHPTLRDRARTGCPERRRFAGRRMGWLETILRGAAILRSAQDPPPPRVSGIRPVGIRHPPFAIVPERAVLSAGDLPGAGWNGLKSPCAGQPSCARRRISIHTGCPRPTRGARSPIEWGCCATPGSARG